MQQRSTPDRRTISSRGWLLSGLLCLSAGCLAADSPADQFRREYAAYTQLVNQGQTRKARPHARAAYLLGEQLFEPDSENLAALTYNYGLTLLDAGRLEDLEDSAEDILEQALDRYELAFGKQSPDLIPVLMDLGTARADYGDSSRQSKSYDRALKIAANEYGKDSRRYAELLTEAGSKILSRSHTRSARKYLEAGYKSMLETAGPNDPGTGYAAFWLAKFKMSGRRYKEAENYLSAALATFTDPDMPQNQMELTTHAFLVEVYEELGKSQDATRHCQAIGRMSPISDDQDYQPLYKRAPEYPYAAREMGKSGWVIVRFTVDEEGIVRDPEVVEVEGSDVFRNAAVEAARKFRYAPRFDDGQPVATSGVLHRISFVIE